MSFQDRFYNFVLYNRSVKSAAGRMLRSRLINNNYFYQKKYKKLLTEKMSKHENVPFRVMIENTNACNSDCTFCPHSRMKRANGFMNKELFEKVVDDCVKSGIEYVTVYGFGEPLLDKHFVERIKYAKSQGIKRVTTNTNAELLNPDLAKEIIKAGLDEIYISFDAATAETFKKIRPTLDFNKVENNIKELVRLRNSMAKKKPEVVLSFVEASENKHEVKKYIKKWKNIVDNISISEIHNWTGELADKLDIRVGKFKKDPCRLLWTDMVISWDGRVPKCCNDYENEVILGDVNNQSIAEIWGGEKMKELREKHKAGDFSGCPDCTYNYHHKSPWWISK